MFCNYCGAEIQADQQFCGSCGKPAGPVTGSAAPPAPSPAGRVARHARLLAILWIAFSALQLLRSGGRLIGARVLGRMGHVWFDDMPWGWPMGHLIPTILSIVGLLSLALAITGFLIGFGLLERHSWARTLAIIFGVIALLNPILGTALGIYTLWVLLPAASEAEWRRTCARR